MLNTWSLRSKGSKGSLFIYFYDKLYDMLRTEKIFIKLMQTGYETYKIYITLFLTNFKNFTNKLMQFEITFKYS